MVEEQTDNEVITAQLVVALKDIKSTILGGWVGDGWVGGPQLH